MLAWGGCAATAWDGQRPKAYAFDLSGLLEDNADAVPQIAVDVVPAPPVYMDTVQDPGDSGQAAEKVAGRNAGAWTGSPMPRAPTRVAEGRRRSRMLHGDRRKHGSEDARTARDNVCCSRAEV